MDNLKIVPKEKDVNNPVKLKLTETNNGITITLDDYYEYWLVKLENQTDGSVKLKTWIGHVGADHELTKQNYECSGDTAVYKIQKIK